MELKIRAVTEADAESIVRLLSPIVEAGIYTVMSGPISVDGQRAFIRALPERAIYHAAISAETHAIVGIQDVQPLSSDEAAFAHVGEVSTFVELGERRRGIGGALTQATFEAARARRFRKLCASVRADNSIAVAFYLGQGFRIVGTAERHAWVRGRYVDEVMMETFIESSSRG